MDPIKEAFNRIKEDIFLLQQEILSLKNEILTIKKPTNEFPIPTNMAIPTNNTTNNPTIPQEIKGFKVEQNTFSTGNKGVPTDNPANRQIVPQTDKMLNLNQISPENPFMKVQETLESLDAIRKELRLKLKKLTSQEMLVFTTLYSLENQGIEDITYKLLASHLNLTESSIRDYILKLLSKGIPIKKIRQNNKKIVLSIHEDLKKLASLSTIIRLKDI
jgi:hypothetical protein